MADLETRSPSKEPMHWSEYPLLAFCGISIILIASNLYLNEIHPYVQTFLQNMK